MARITVVTHKINCPCICNFKLSEKENTDTVSQVTEKRCKFTKLTSLMY